MKVSLIVVSPGKMNQKPIAVTRPYFVIGREADCQVRPASAMVSKRHCALLVGENGAFIDDLGSTNGTFLNDQPVRDKTELHDQDLLRVGPLLFTVRLEANSIGLPKQPQPSRETSAEEVAAALLLSMPDRPKPRFPSTPGGESAPPPAETGLDPGTTQSGARASDPKEKDAIRQKTNPSKPDMGGTALAAKAILKKYQHSDKSSRR
jgi:pSer/pThr/pTyr-binding forkhead associated (FHA) protein